jgi:hypothetical protein
MESIDVFNSIISDTDDNDNEHQNIKLKHELIDIPMIIPSRLLQNHDDICSNACENNDISTLHASIKTNAVKEGTDENGGDFWDESLDFSVTVKVYLDVS